MTRRLYVPNPTADLEYAQSDGARRTVARAVDAIIPNVIRHAPRDSGDYVRKIEGDVTREADGWTGRVIAGDWKSALIEWGTGGPGPTPAFAPLRRGVESAGLERRGGRT